MKYQVTVTLENGAFWDEVYYSQDAVAKLLLSLNMLEVEQVTISPEVN